MKFHEVEPNLSLRHCRPAEVGLGLTAVAVHRHVAFGFRTAEFKCTE